MAKRGSSTVTAVSGPSLHETLVNIEFPQGAEAEAGAAGAVPKALRIEREGSVPLEITLYPDRTYVFGRAPEASFVFPSDAVSRLHGQLRFTGDAWRFRDLNSRNGSFVASPAKGAGRGDPRSDARLLRARNEHVVRVGESVLLANRQSRLVFLAELSAGAGPAAQGKSAASQALDRSIEVCARHRLPVFLLGPSGSGKTFVARTIHERARMPGLFVILNCGRLPHDPAQLASELLGHVKGAFTGAVTERKGKLWSADQGTLFLDEVESLPRVAQDFLVDLLEGSGSFAPMGAAVEFNRPPPWFRLVSASKVPLARSGLRPDLCQRLAMGDVVVLPTLQERRQDIPQLVDAFIERLRAEQRIDAELTVEAVRHLQAAQWPGEIRELESTVKVVVNRELAGQLLDGLGSEKLVVGVQSVRDYLERRQQGFGAERAVREAPEPTAAGVRKRPGDLTRQEVLDALEASGGNKTRAAAALGIALNTLKARLRRL